MRSHFSKSFSLVGVRSDLPCFVTKDGRTNWVPTTPPTPTVEAKSLPPSLSSTWSPKNGTLSPVSAFNVFTLERTWNELVGSEATDILKCGMVKKENAVPQGQNSTRAPGFTDWAVA